MDSALGEPTEQIHNQGNSKARASVFLCSNSTEGDRIPSRCNRKAASKPETGGT